MRWSPSVTVAAVIRNPYAGRYVEDLSPLYDLGAEVGKQPPGPFAADTLRRFDDRDARERTHSDIPSSIVRVAPVT